LIKKTEFFKLLGKEFKEIDLRLLYIKLRESNLNNAPVFQEFRNVVVEAMTRGQYLVLNFDDCSVKYEELFDPDIKEFYGNGMLSPFMWTPNMFFQTTTWQSHLKQSTEKRLDKGFKFIAYSKFVIEIDLQEHDLINVIEKRFEKSFPLFNMNVIILSKFE
jgi:hypothetical protein